MRNLWCWLFGCSGPVTWNPDEPDGVLYRGVCRTCQTPFKGRPIPPAPKKLIMVFVALLILTGCSEKPVKEKFAGHSYELVLLFETKEGHKVYRFVDGGQYRYFVVGGTANWQHTRVFHNGDHDEVEVTNHEIPHVPDR